MGQFGAAACCLGCLRPVHHPTLPFRCWTPPTLPPSVRSRDVFRPRIARSRQTLTAWAFLTPALILLGLSVLIPALMALVMTFTQTGLGCE